MKTKMVSYTLDTLPKLTEADRTLLKKLASLPDSEINTSDIPEVTAEQYQAAKAAGEVFVGRFYRPIKKQITALVDADVIEWLKTDGKGYQSRLNAILRREMLAALSAARKAETGPPPVTSASHAAPSPARARRKK